jgi:hypothetical protein
MTEKMAAFRARLIEKSRLAKAKGFLPPVVATVPMSVYLKALDELNTWRNRAVDAEARLCGSGDILGEGRLDYLKGPSNANNRS